MHRESFLAFCIVIAMAGSSLSADQSILIDAFAQTATAYANDSFLLLGVVGDQFVTGTYDKDSAAQDVRNIQKRIRIIRAKINLVTGSINSKPDKKWLKVLDSVYICLDQQAWAMTKYIDDKSPSNARRFESIRSECLVKIKNLAQFYGSLGASDELPAPLSTR
ncbi:MAG: hypothetical protein NTY51_05375 [Deltaproteobacteria bacterium]|nr:hypothetical protein [Deltaproteobacteria bacterium]